MSALDPVPTFLGWTYIAGPMRGIPEFNFPAFFDAAERLDRPGWVYNPAERHSDGGFDCRGLTGNEDLVALDFDVRVALAEGLTWIARRADSVCVLAGWERSLGAKAEVAAARAVGIPVFSIVDVPS